MKKLKLTLAAVLCCLLTSTLFTGCVKNEDEDKTPAHGVVTFYLENTSDMMQYCDIEVTYGDGNEEPEKVVVSKENTLLDLSWGGTLVTRSLPSTVTFTRKITAKPDAKIEEMKEFAYSLAYLYTSGVCNAAGSVIEQYPQKTVGKEQTTSGATAAALIAEGKLNQTFTFTFDEKGKMTLKVDMAE